MESEGVVYTLGVPYGEPRQLPYPNNDLSPSEVQYSIQAAGGVGVFLPHPYKDRQIILADFHRGVRRNWFFRRNRQYPLYLVDDMFWHEGPQETLWGIVELAESLPSSKVYPWIYDLINLMVSHQGENVSDFSGVTLLQDVTQHYCGCGTLQGTWVSNPYVLEETLDIENIPEVEGTSITSGSLDDFASVLLDSSNTSEEWPDVNAVQDLKKPIGAESDWLTTAGEYESEDREPTQEFEEDDTPTEENVLQLDYDQDEDEPDMTKPEEFDAWTEVTGDQTGREDSVR